MRIRVSGKQIEIGEALPEKVRVQLSESVGKYFDGGFDAHVVFSRERSMFHADCTVHLDAGAVMKSEGEADDAHKAFALALEHMDKQVRRYMRKLKGHHD
ncbi:MAG: ribosome-associated translation inhibitor RaiA [Alphaproteobacteria bacterium]|nr:ribosome-associated translation inhibitor RaiA [Alphaproteobacteria bacterium]